MSRGRRSGQDRRSHIYRSNGGARHLRINSGSAVDGVNKVLSGEISAVEPDTAPAAEEDKGSPDTGVEGIAAAAAIAVLAGAGIALSRKHR